MADQNLVEVRIGGDVSALRSASREATGHVDGLLASLKDFKSEAVSTGREARFFANELSAIIPGASQAKAVLQDLIAAGLAGGGIGAALEGVKVAAHYFNELSSEEAKAAEELKKFATEGAEHIAQLRDQIEQQVLAFHGASEMDLQYRREILPLQSQERALLKDIAGLEASVASARANTLAIDDLTLAAQHGLIAADEQELAKKRALLTEIQNQIAARKELLDLLAREYALQAENTVAVSALIADLTRRQQEYDEAVRKSVEDRHRQMDEAVKAAQNAIKYEQDLEKAEIGRITRVHEAEAAANVALQQFNERRLAELAKGEQKSKELTKEQRTELHALAHAAEEVGRTLGEVFAGIASGSMSAGQAVVEMLKTVIKALIETAIKMVMAHAAAAAAGAAESQSWIPGAGPFLAIGALAAVEGAVLGLLSLIPSAAVGMPTVPADGPVFVHKNEAILTTEQAEAWRAGRGGGMGGDVHVHIHGVIDGDHLMRVVASNDFRRAMREARRNGLL